MNEKTKRTAGWAVVVVAMVIATFLGIRFPIPEAPVEEPAGAAIRPVQFRSVNVAQDLTVGGAQTTTGDTTMTGALDVGGTLNYGTVNSYPVGNAASGKKLMIGVTGAVVQSATVVPTAQAISTVTAFGCEPDDALFSGAWNCRAAMGATNNITFTLYNASSTPVPTAAYDEIRYFVAGN